MDILLGIIWGLVSSRDVYKGRMEDCSIHIRVAFCEELGEVAQVTLKREDTQRSLYLTFLCLPGGQPRVKEGRPFRFLFGKLVSAF